MKVIVVGGGASGLRRAVCRADKGHSVTVIERAASAGRKLLVTGSGKCNYFNSDMDISHFHSRDSERLAEIMSGENIERVKNLYSAVGIVPYVKDGYWYPQSQQAVNVLNCFTRACAARNVKFVTDTEITDITGKDGKFVLNGRFTSDRVILCTGSSAYYKKAKCFTYGYLKKTGHKVYDEKPALVQMTSDDRILKQISGVRANVSVTLCNADGEIRTADGEIQFTDYGISGICTMILSRDYTDGAYVKINLARGIAEKPYEFRKFFTEYGKTQNCAVGDILDSVLNYKLTNAVCARLKIANDTPFSRLGRADIDRIADEVTSFRLNLTGTKGFDSAQTVTGGASLDEINTHTMESRRVKGLYLCGEAVDIDGDCGGYNLTAAFLTGMLAGNSV